ncbi:MAG: BON domain-containing protein [Planctomycetes bacterium]|nr:BON domain-containing protein [Planctomycetota bacterium]
MSLQTLDSYEVLQSAMDSLRSRLGTGVNDVSCDYRNSVLYLCGWCNTFYQKQLAQEAVRSVDGVLQVVNRIQVVARAK